LGDEATLTRWRPSRDQTRAARLDLVSVGNRAAGALPDDYLPAALRAEVAGARDGVMGFLTRDASRVHAHAVRNSEVSPQQRSYRCYHESGASAEVWNYSTLAEDLASHG